MNPETLYVALGTTISLVVSLGAAGISLFALLRPGREYHRLQARVSDLASLRSEWQDTLTALDSINRRNERLVKREQRQQELAAEGHELPAASGRRRTLSLTEITNGKVRNAG